MLKRTVRFFLLLSILCYPVPTNPAGRASFIGKVFENNIEYCITREDAKAVLDANRARGLSASTTVFRERGCVQSYAWVKIERVVDTYHGITSEEGVIKTWYIVEAKMRGEQRGLQLNFLIPPMPIYILTPTNVDGGEET